MKNPILLWILYSGKSLCRDRPSYVARDFINFNHIFTSFSAYFSLDIQHLPY